MIVVIKLLAAIILFTESVYLFVVAKLKQAYLVQ